VLLDARRLTRRITSGGSCTTGANALEPEALRPSPLADEADHISPGNNEEATSGEVPLRSAAI